MDAIQRTGCQFVAGMACHGDQARFRWMLVLLMTSPCSHEDPAIVGQQTKSIANLHAVKIGRGFQRGKRGAGDLALQESVHDVQVHQPALQMTERLWNRADDAEGQPQP